MNFGEAFRFWLTGFKSPEKYIYLPLKKILKDFFYLWKEYREEFFFIKPLLCSPISWYKFRFYGIISIFHLTQIFDINRLILYADQFSETITRVENLERAFIFELEASKFDKINETERGGKS